jgi:phosphohistidine phosphatase
MLNFRPREIDAADMQLMLLRHAKAEKGSPGLRDRDRELNARGQADAAMIAAYMATHELEPDGVIVSSAQRTRETWQCMAKAFAALPVAYEDRLYDAGPESILTVIRELGRSATMLLVIGHNPGLYDTARQLIAPSAGEAHALDDGLPTAGLLVIDLAGKDWRKLALRSGRLERFVTPRQIKDGKA